MIQQSIEQDELRAATLRHDDILAQATAAAQATQVASGVIVSANSTVNEGEDEASFLDEDNVSLDVVVVVVWGL